MLAQTLELCSLGSGSAETKEKCLTFKITAAT